MPESQSHVATPDTPASWDQNPGPRTHRNPSTANVLPDPNRNPNPPPPIPHSTRPNLNPPHATENAGGNGNVPSTKSNSDPHFLDPAVWYAPKLPDFPYQPPNSRPLPLRPQAPYGTVYHHGPDPRYPSPSPSPQHHYPVPANFPHYHQHPCVPAHPAAPVSHMTSMQYQYPPSPYIPAPPEFLEPPVIPTHHPPHCSCATPPNVIVYPSPW